MANTDFRVLLKAVLDKSGINTELKEVQDIINKHSVDIIPELKTASLRNQMKSVSKDIANDFNKTFGTNLTGSDIFKAYENQAKQVVEQNKIVQQSFTDLRKSTYQSIGNKSPELQKMAEIYKQEAIEADKAAEAIAKVNAEQNKLVQKSFTDIRKDAYQSIGSKSPELQQMAEMYRQEAIEADKVAVSASKINQAIASGNNEAKIEQLAAKFRGLGLSSEETQKELAGVNSVLLALKNSSDNTSLVTNAKLLGEEYSKVSNRVKILSSEFKGFATESQRLSTTNTIKSWADNNSKSLKVFGTELNQLYTKLNNPNLSLTELKQVDAQFQNIKVSARETGLLGKSVGDSFAEAGKKFTSWITITGGIMALVDSVRKMKDIVFELDKTTTDLTMATGLHGEELKKLLSTYSDLGDQLRANINDVTISATEWLKQGKTISETNKLISDSVVLSKIGNMSTADSTKYLTSAMKGYKVSVEDTLGVVDKLSAVDLVSATDVGGLAEGMSQVAATADLAGVSMDKLLGYLAVVGETTQEGMSSVGTSFNAIFSRMGNIKLSRLKDYQNSGEDLSNVETVLKGEGIALRDSVNDFRDFGDVLDEVSGRWNNFSEVSQRAIASAFAGTHHMNDFIILMENYSTALKYTDTSLQSSGEAMQKFSAYQDSLAGHTEKFKNSFMGLSSAVIDSSALKVLIDSGTAFSGVLTSIIKNLGLFGVAVAGIGITGLAKNFESIKTWMSELGNVQSIINGLNNQAILTNAGTGLLTTESMTTLSSAVAGLNEQQALLVLSTKNLTAEQVNQVLVNAGIIASNEQIGSSLIQRALAETALNEEQKSAILTKLGLIDADTGLIISSAACTKEELLQALATQGVTGANAEAIISTLGLAEANKGATVSFGLLGNSIKSMLLTNPVGWLILIGTAIYGTVKAVDYFSDSVEEVKEKVNDLMTSYSSAINTANTNAKKTEDLISQYENLSNGVNNLGENVSLTTEEYSKYNNVVNEIAEMFPDLIIGYDDQGNAILSLKGNVDQLRDAYKEAQKEAYNLLITSGKDSDGADIITDYKNESRDQTWLEKSSSFFGNTSTTDSIDALQKLLNATTGSVNDFKDLYNQLYEIYGDDFSKISNAIDTSNWSNWTEKDIQAMASTIKANIQTLQSEIDSSLSNVKTLANAYLMTNSDYEKLDEQSKNAASIIVNSLNEGVANGFTSKEDVGSYVQNIVNTIKDNPEAKKAMIGLFTLDYSDMPIDEASETINKYIDYIAKILGEDPVTLKIRLGFEDFGNLETEYNSAIESAKDKFGQDETSFFKVNSINTPEEVDNWNKIAAGAKSAAEAERLYLEQGKSAPTPSFISEFENLPVDKIEEYISLVKSGNIDEGAISSFSELNDLMSKTGMSAEDAAKALKDYADGYTLSTDLTSNIQESYDLLKEIEEQYEKTGLIGLSSLESIASKYPQLRSAVNEYTQGLISADDVMSQLQTAYDNDAMAFRSAMAYKLSGNEDFFSTIVNNNRALFDDLGKAYGLDVSNWKTMAQAKAEIDQKLIQNLSSAWSKYYNIVFDNASGMASFAGQDVGHGSSHGIAMSEEQQKAWSEANNQVNKYNQIINRLNEAAAIQVEPPDFGGIGSIGNKSGGSDKEKSKKEYSEVFDWITTTIDRVNEKVEALQNKISDTSNWKSKNALTDTTIDEMSDKLVALRSQVDIYQAKANTYDLSPTYIDKIKNGTLEIETITDEVIGNNIKSYQEWYNKAEDVRKQIDETKKSMKELAQSRLDNIINDFESLTSLSEKYASLNKSALDLQKNLGEEIDSTDYESLIDQQESIYKQLENEYEALSLELSKAVSKGTIKIGTDEWRKYNGELLDVKSSMNDVVSSMNDFREAMLNTAFDKISDAADELDRMNSGYGALADLIGGSGLTNDKGMITSKGLAKIAIYGQQYAIAKQNAANYAQAIEEVKDAYADGTLTQAEYNEKIKEYESAQLSAVQATKQAEDAIVQFRKDAIQEQINDYNDLIAKKKEALQHDKSYADYLEEVAEKQKAISTLQAKIDELSTKSDTSDRSALAMRLQLENDLVTAKKDLAKTQADYAYDQTTESLDKQAKDYEDAKNKELDELETSYDAQQKVIEDYLGQVKDNYKTVYNTLTQYGENYNVSVTEDLVSPWDSASSAVDTFQNAVSDAISQINIDLASIDLSSLTDMVSTMNGLSGGGSSSGFEDITGTGTWHKNKTGDWYGASDDDYASDGIYTIGGKQYSFNEDGYMKTGWNDDSGSWRYFEPENGQMVKSTWRKGSDGKDYYLTSDGTMATDTAVKAKSGNGYYYVDSDGVWDGKTLSYDDVKKKNISVSYKNGTDSTVSGLKNVGEDDIEELIITKNGAILSSKGQDTVFTGSRTDVLRDFSKDPTSYITDKLLRNQMDLNSVATTNNSKPPISLTFNIDGDNVSSNNLNDFKIWATKELPSIIQQNMGSY